MNHINRLDIKNKNECHVDHVHNEVDMDTTSIGIGDTEQYIDSLLSHTREDNCAHPLMDLLDEIFDKSNNDNKKWASGVNDKATDRINNDHPNNSLEPPFSNKVKQGDCLSS